MHEAGNMTFNSCSHLAKHLILWISDPLATPTECVTGAIRTPWFSSCSLKLTIDLKHG